MRGAKDLPSWAIALIAIAVGAAVFSGWHYYDVKGDLEGALKDEFRAVMFYGQMSDSGIGIDIFRGVDYGEIREDEKDHVVRLDKYVDLDKSKVLIIEDPYPLTREGARESEIDAIENYQRIIGKVWFNRGLKEDLRHILSDELDHYEILNGAR